MSPKTEQTLHNAEHCVRWLDPTNSPTAHRGHQPSPLHFSLSPFWEEGHSSSQCVAHIRSHFAFWLSLHSFTLLVALTLVVWTFHSSLKNAQHRKRQCPPWPLRFPGLPSTPKQSGASHAPSPLPGLPRSGHSSFPPFIPQEGESPTGQRGRLRPSRAFFDKDDGEKGHRSRDCIWKHCCRVLLLNPGNFP